MEPTKLQSRHRRHVEDLKVQIARSLEKELNLLAEERSERARRLGLAVQEPAKPACEGRA